MLLVVAVLIFFLYDLRAGLIVAASIPLALLFAFICLDLQNASANLLSIGAVDFGILVDGAVVMVENIFRQMAARQAGPLDVMQIIKDAAARSGPPAGVCSRGDRRRLSADLRAVGTFRKAVQTDGGHDGVRARRFADRHADTVTDAVFVVHAPGRTGAAQCSASKRSSRSTSGAWMPVSPIPGGRRSRRPCCWRSRCC